MKIESTLLKYAVWLLGRRAYSEAEIRKKLIAKVAKVKQRTGESVRSGDDETPAGASTESTDSSGQGSVSTSYGQNSSEAPEDPIERVIQKLLNLKYLNDAAFAKNFIDAEIRRKPQSLRIIKQKLLHKGIKSDLVEDAICARRGSGNDETGDNEVESGDLELDMARAAAIKKIKTLRAQTPLKQKEKLYRFLAARGFTSSTIFKVLREALEQT